jgi:hypothetical protein
VTKALKTAWKRDGEGLGVGGRHSTDYWPQAAFTCQAKTSNSFDHMFEMNSGVYIDVQPRGQSEVYKKAHERLNPL